MAKFDLKDRVFELRRAGSSIKDIACEVGLSKSTISLWCRDVELTPAQQKKLQMKMIEAGHRGRLLGSIANRRKKESSMSAAREWAEEAIGAVTGRDALVIGAALYWAEGSKSDKYQLSFVNSDPAMIKFMQVHGTA